MAAVYPKRLCQLLSVDLWRILRVDRGAVVRRWPLQYLHSGVYYKCEKCTLGKSAPPGAEHTLVPGECRYGQPAYQPAARDSRAARPQRSDLEDPTSPFKMLARSGDYSKVRIALPASLPLSAESVLYLKAALMSMIETCLPVFEKMTHRDYDHWLSDPILLRVFQDVFAGHLNVLGVLSSLRPWCRKVPDPYLSSSCAPIRLLLAGTLRDWVVHDFEDMALLSHSQLHAPVEEADWHVHVFGVLPLEKRKHEEDSHQEEDSHPGDARPGDHHLNHYLNRSRVQAARLQSLLLLREFRPTPDLPPAQRLQHR